MSTAAPQYYVSTCPDTGRQFICETGKDNNLAEVAKDRTDAGERLALCMTALAGVPSEDIEMSLTRYPTDRFSQMRYLADILRTFSHDQ